MNYRNDIHWSECFNKTNSLTKLRVKSSLQSWNITEVLQLQILNVDKKSSNGGHKARFKEKINEPKNVKPACESHGPQEVHVTWYITVSVFLSLSVKCKFFCTSLVKRKVEIQRIVKTKWVQKTAHDAAQAYSINVKSFY